MRKQILKKLKLLDKITQVVNGRAKIKARTSSWGWGSLGEHLPSTCKAMNSIPALSANSQTD
jgi:hypothetical protein